MPATVETHQDARRFEEELHELEESESALERRADSLALTNVLSLVFAFFALAISIVAILVAVLADDDDANTAAQVGAAEGVAQAPAGSGATQERGQSGGLAMPDEMARDRTAVNAAETAVRTVRVKLGEMWVRPQYTSVEAGKVVFAVRNTGQVEHELMVERAPLKMEAPGMPDHDAALAATEHLAPGDAARLSARLAPGEYVLFCNVSGHYAAGQFTRFTVTKS